MADISKNTMIENRALREALVLVYTKNENLNTIVCALLLQGGVEETTITEETISLVADQELEVEIDEKGEVTVRAFHPAEEQTEGV